MNCFYFVSSEAALPTNELVQITIAHQKGLLSTPPRTSVSLQCKCNELNNQHRQNQMQTTNVKTNSTPSSSAEWNDQQFSNTLSQLIIILFSTAQPKHIIWSWFKDKRSNVRKFKIYGERKCIYNCAKTHPESGSCGCVGMVLPPLVVIAIEGAYYFCIFVKNASSFQSRNLLVAVLPYTASAYVQSQTAKIRLCGR